MSVIVTIRVKGDASAVEKYAADNSETMLEIKDKAKAAGATAHRMYGDDEGGLMVVDEWPDFESFHAFFESTGDKIGPLMAAAGADGPPEIKSWRKLETVDNFGWED